MSARSDAAQRQHLHRRHAAGGGRSGGGVRPVPLRVGQHVPRHLRRGVAAEGGTGRPDRRRAGRLGQGASSSTPTTPSTSRSTSTSATSCTPRPGPSCATRTWSATATSRSPRARAICASCRRRHHRAGEHPARAGSRRAARRTAAGAQGARRHQGQRGEQRGHRTAAGPGRRAVEPAGQHRRPSPRTSPPGTS